MLELPCWAKEQQLEAERQKIRHEMTAVLERIALNKLQRPCSDLCDLLFVSLDYTGRFREEISLGLVILLSRRLPACLMFLSPSVASFSFFSPLQPRMVSSLILTNCPPLPSLPVLAVPQGSTHLVSIMFAAALVSHPSLPPVSCLPFLSFFSVFPSLSATLCLSSL